MFKAHDHKRWMTRLALALALAAIPLMGGAAPLHTPDNPSPVISASGKPVLWHVTQKGSSSKASDLKLCTGEGMLDGFELLRSTSAVALPNCTTAKSRNGDGSTSTVSTCGDLVLRGTISAGGDDMRVHIEMPQSGPEGATNKRQVFDAHYVKLGDCPASRKPGQALLADGEIIDPNAMFTAILDPAKALADPANAPPPITPIPLSGKVVRRSFELEKYDPASCGHLKSSKPPYSFGSRAKRWDVQLIIGVRLSGQPDAVPTVLADGGDPEDLDVEPNYTVRLGGYTFTPPIAQQDTVRSAGLLSAKSILRTDAWKAAKAKGDTRCTVSSCTLSERDRDDFLRAFDETARRGGELTVSAPSPIGPVTEEFSLQGLGGFIERTQACIKATS